MKKVIKQTYPPRIKKVQSHSLKRKKLTLKQEKLKREVQNIKSKDDTNKP